MLLTQKPTKIWFWANLTGLSLFIGRSQSVTTNSYNKKFLESTNLLNLFDEIILPLNSHEKQLPSKVLSEDHRKFHQLAIGSEPSSAFSTYPARLALISVSNPRGSAYSCEETDRLPAFSNENSKTIDLQSQIMKKSYQ